MYIVNIYNSGVKSEIHGEREKLYSGSVVQGINAIDSFTFSILPSNAGFNSLQEFKTLVSVYNESKKRYEFWGRVLYPQDGMTADGKITKDVTCESFMAYLVDSRQPYIAEQNWTVAGLLQHIIDKHNERVEEEKQFTLGSVTVTDPNDNLYCGIQRESTWDTLKKKLLDTLGGEFCFRVVDGVIYLDYLTEIGATKATTIELSKNMKAITREKNPSEYITRLIPLGHKLSENVITTDSEGNEVIETVETEQRLDITSVNGGLDYIEDAAARIRYGIHEEYVEFDDVTDASNLLTKGQKWLEENNKIQVKYSIDTLDLSLLGLDIDDFTVGNRHPIKNKLLGIDDTARIIKKTIDICEEVKTSIEIGDNFKALSDIQLEQAGQLNTATSTIEKIEADYVTNQALKNVEKSLSTIIKQTESAILLQAQDKYTEIDGEQTTIKERLSAVEVTAEGNTSRVAANEERITEVDGVLTTVKESFESTFTHNTEDGSVTLKNSNSTTYLKLENDRLSLIVNGVERGFWNVDYFYTGNILIRLDDRFQFGNFAIVPRSDGSAQLLKVGD